MEDKTQLRRWDRPAVISVLAQPGVTGEDAMSFVEYVRLTMGRAAPLFPNTVDSMIQSYAQLKAAQRKKLE